MHSTRISLEKIGLHHAEALHQLRLQNRAFLEPWEPLRTEEFYTLANQESGILQSMQAAEQHRSYSYMIREHESGQWIGRANLNNVVRGVFDNAYLGYFMSEAFNGKGYMTEAVYQLIRLAFQELGLHRIQAATLTNNQASIRVLQKNGFRQEGEAKRYLKINGKWEDHYLFAITSEEIESD